MGFYERITREEEPKIPVHTVMALLGEWERGKLTLSQVSSALGLTSGEETEAGALLAQMVPPREAITLGAVPAGHTLTNVGTSYDAITASQNMGFAHVQAAGITQVIFGLRVNKVGSGTQSWQLWNETDGSEVAVVDDAGGTGLKYLSTTKDFGSALGPGMKIVRVRVKSTTGADDPVYYGSTISIRRVSVLTSLELHEILLLADSPSLPYGTSTALKARLGVT